MKKLIKIQDNCFEDEGDSTTQWRKGFRPLNFSLKDIVIKKQYINKERETVFDDNYKQVERIKYAIAGFIDKCEAFSHEELDYELTEAKIYLANKAENSENQYEVDEDENLFKLKKVEFTITEYEETAETKFISESNYKDKDDFIDGIIFFQKSEYSSYKDRLIIDCKISSKLMSSLVNDLFLYQNPSLNALLNINLFNKYWIYRGYEAEFLIDSDSTGAVFLSHISIENKIKKESNIDKANHDSKKEELETRSKELMDEKSERIEHLENSIVQIRNSIGNICKILLILAVFTIFLIMNST